MEKEDYMEEQEAIDVPDSYIRNMSHVCQDEFKIRNRNQTCGFANSHICNNCNKIIGGSVCQICNICLSHRGRHDETIIVDGKRGYAHYAMKDGFCNNCQRRNL